MRNKKLIFIILIVVGVFLLIFKDPILSLGGIIIILIGLFNLNKSQKKEKVNKKKEVNKEKKKEFVFVWEKVKWYQQFFFIIGWTGVINLFFWIFILWIYFNNKKEEQKFFNKHTLVVPYIFGIFYCFILIMVITYLKFG